MFIHVYEPGATHQCSDISNGIVRLELQRWAGLAPVYSPDSPPLLCRNWPLSCTDGRVITEEFKVDTINAPGDDIVFEHLRGKKYSYLQYHQIGDTNYADHEHLWVLVLGRGGIEPMAPQPPSILAQADDGVPGIYTVTGMLELKAVWDTPFYYEYSWQVPVSFRVVLNAPIPLD